MRVARFEVPGECLRAHAANLDTLRSRFTTVRETSERMRKDRSAFGSVCGWILAGLGDRHARQDELIAYVEESLQLVAAGLRKVAAGECDLVSMCGEPDPTDDVTSCVDDESSMTRGMVARLIDAIQEQMWVDELLADPPVAEFAVGATDTITALRAAGLAWVLSTVEPLRQMLDDLAGMPDVVDAHARLWEIMATDLRGIAADLQLYLDTDLWGFSGPGVQAYLAMMAHNVVALRGLADISAAIGLITGSAGQLIVLVRDIVRGLIADWVAGAIASVARRDGLAPMRAAVGQLAAGVVASRRIHAYIAALVASMANLSSYLDG